MAVVPRVSQAITDSTSTPRVMLNPVLNAARLLEKVGVIASAADDSATSVYRFLRLPSNARVSQIMLSAADATTAGAIDIGLYQTADNGGAVVDADLFASAVDLASGPYLNADQTFESGQYTFAESQQPLWQVLGLTADPGIEYDLAATVTTTFNGGPTSIRLAARYVQQ